MKRQITTSQIDLKVDTGTGEYSFQGYPTNVDIFSGSLTWQPQYFADKKMDKALSGRLRSRLQGYRLMGSLTWERSLETNVIADVLAKVPYGVERVFWTGTTPTFGTVTTFTITPAPATADTFNGMMVTFDGGFNRTVTDYASGTVTINSSVSIGGTEEVQFLTIASMPTVVYYAPNATDPTSVNEVILDGAIGASIESTIVRQPITVTLEGVEISPNIPGYYLQ